MKEEIYWQILYNYKEMLNALSSKICSIVENVLTLRGLSVGHLPCNIRLKPVKAVVKMYKNVTIPLSKL